jgi:biopolymer transport protein ExbD
MSAGSIPGAGGGGGRGEESQEFDLNLAPIIDCFTVLITFMLASAAFLSIGIFDAGVAAAGAAPSSQKPPSINVVIELNRAQQLQIKVSGKANTTTTLNAKDGAPDFDSLRANLDGLKGKYSDLAAVTLSAETTVQYKDVIKTMEATRKSIPVVMLGGF